MVQYVMTPGGVNTVLNITAPAVIKASQGNVVTVTVSQAGSAGNLTINDCITTGAATAANQIVSIAYSELTQPIISFNWFVALNGITISSVPTGSVLSIAYA